MIDRTASKSISWRHFGESEFGRAYRKFNSAASSGRRKRNTTMSLTHQASPKLNRIPCQHAMVPDRSFRTRLVDANGRREHVDRPEPIRCVAVTFDPESQPGFPFEGTFFRNSSGRVSLPNVGQVGCRDRTGWV